MLSEKTLKSSLESGAVLPVYILGGEDIYLKKQALNRIIEKTVAPDDEMNLIKFSSGIDLQEVYNELGAFPVMSDKKCVILSDFDIEGAPKTEFEKLCEIVASGFDTAVFILYFGTVELDFKKSSRLKKLIEAAEQVGGAVVRLDHKTNDELARWLSASAKKRGLELSFKNAEYMIEICSSDISVLNTELSKLCAFKKSGEITRDVIDSVCVKSVEASVYDLSSKIIVGDTAGAMKLLDELFFMNIEPMVVFYNISSAFVDMYRAYAAKAEGKNPEALARDFNMANKGFLLKKAAVNLRKYDENKLELSFDAIISAERELKGYSSDSRIVLEKLIVKLIYIMKTGEAID